MKKRTLLILAILLVLSYWRYQGSQVKYPAGKDTGISFGDGTYQLLTGSRDSIYHLSYNSCLIEQVDDVLVRSGKVYVLGSVPLLEEAQETSLLAVINLKTNQIALCFLPQNYTTKLPFIPCLDEMLENKDAILLNQFSDFSEEDQMVFQEMDEKQAVSP